MIMKKFAPKYSPISQNNQDLMRGYSKNLCEMRVPPIATLAHLCVWQLTRRICICSRMRIRDGLSVPEPGRGFSRVGTSIAAQGRVWRTVAPARSRGRVVSSGDGRLFRAWSLEKSDWNKFFGIWIQIFWTGCHQIMT